MRCQKDSWRFLIVLLSTPLFSGCPEPTQQVSIQTYELAVILPQQLDGSGLPDDLATLATPIAAEACPGKVYSPTLTLVPAWQDPPDRVSVAAHEDDDWTAAVRRFYRAPTSPDTRRKAVQKHFASFRLPAGFARQPGQATTADLRSSPALPEGTDGGALFALSRPGGVNEKSVIVGPTVAQAYADPERLTKAIAEHLCRAETGSGNQQVTVIYHYAGASVTDPPTTKGPATKGPGGGIPDAPAIPSADEKIAAIQSRLKTASKGELKTIENELVRAELTYALDYRFPYEHAKLVVFGRAEHHEAFNLLFNAGERALKAGEGPEMLALLRQDAREGGPLHKLAHGHHEWSNLLDALADGDSERLAQGGSHSQHHGEH